MTKLQNLERVEVESIYAAFLDSAKRDILRWIKMAKKPATRAKRIQETAALAARNERASGTS